MLDHLGIFVPAARFKEIIDWYTAVLAPLGYSKQIEIPNKAIGFGTSKQSAPFWISTKEGGEITSTHFAIKANDHAAVDKSYEEAIKAGGKDNGKPGLRDHYHPGYYAMFVIDPVGNNFEVVDHGMPPSA